VTGGAPVGVDPERVARYLRARLPEAQDLRVVSLNRNVGGTSRETWFAEVEWTTADGPATAAYTIRIDHPDADPQIPLAFEHAVYAALSDSGIPVPRARWHESDPEWIGRPFYVRDAIAGSTSPNRLFAPDATERRARIGRDFAEKLALVHTADWRALGLDRLMTVPESPVDSARTELRRWTDYYAEHRVEDRPVLSGLLSWLAGNAPREVDRISLVWGDVGLGNFIYRDDEVVGLIDWEYAHLGDPMKDWASAFMRGVQNLLPEEELFAHYARAGGIPVDRARIEYYTAFISAQYSILSAPLLQRIEDRDGRVDVTVPRNCVGMPYQLERDALRIVGRLSAGRPVADVR
jgi:aminoglycoside phosphotransferase (APT) family kinase protein